MFSSIGWTEIAVIVVIGLIIIGPERLPGVIKDVQAAIYAARKAIANARAELDGEFGDLGKEFEEFREPLQQVARFQRMGPRGLISRALFEEEKSDKQPKPTSAPTPAPSPPRQTNVSRPPESQPGFDWDDIM